MTPDAPPAARGETLLLAGVAVPFVQDGWRDGERVRQWMHDRFLEPLRSDRHAFETLTGDWPTRRAKAIDAIGRLLAQFRRF